MNYALKRQVYEALPSPFKRAVGKIPFSFLAGKSYRRVLRQEGWIGQAQRSEIGGYQEKRLSEVLQFACEQVPAYQHLRAQVQRYRPSEALKWFPPITKKELQQGFSQYLPRSLWKIPHYECTTGGTSGNQLRFYLDNDSQAVDTAFVHRQWARVGYSSNARKATFRGVEFPNLEPGVYWQENPIYNEIQFSPFHMTPRTVGAYWEKILDYRPSFFHGYPSAISLLAEYVDGNGLSGRELGLRAALLVSEGCSAEQRRLIEGVFQTRVFSFYGHSERVILGAECEYSTDYHHVPDYGILEILDEDTGQAVREGNMGELVGTGFMNRSLPLIRYRTEDYARRLEYRCECGREFDRFGDVEGRWKQEYVIGKNGSKISPAALNMHGTAFGDVLRYQYCQRVPGVLEVRLMVSDRFEAVSEQALLRTFERKVGDELDIVLQVVDEIPLTSRGKLRRLIQEIPGT
jgi:phenylacetate-CoA ligase